MLYAQQRFYPTSVLLVLLILLYRRNHPPQNAPYTDAELLSRKKEQVTSYLPQEARGYTATELSKAIDETKKSLEEYSRWTDERARERAEAEAETKAIGGTKSANEFHELIQEIYNSKLKTREDLVALQQHRLGILQEELARRETENI